MNRMIRKTLLFAVGIALSMTAAAQKIVLGEHTSVSLPAGAQGISREQYKADKKYNSRPISSNHIFLYGPLLFAVYDAQPAISPDYLEKTKRWRDEMHSWNKNDNTYISNITNIHKKNILLVEGVHKDQGSIDFYALNKLKNKTVSGVIIFDLADKAKADSTLYVLIDNLSFH